ncbi:MAG: Uma2 family endonuclease, partial [Nitrospinae bacterium]|nr:Uma2 family endonuclease [Nitrospinota bacterium]
GELIMAPAPLPTHQWILGNLYRTLYNFATLHRLGVVLMAPLDIVIRREPLRTRQPDILYLSAERSGITGGAQLRGMQLLPQAPDLAIEILSPSNYRRGIADKLEDYRTIGVRECWIVSPEAQTVEVVRLSPGGTEVVEIFGTGMTIRSEVLEGFTLPVEEVFA